MPPSTRQHSAAWGLALFYACLIAHASLYPFAPWSNNGLPWWGFVSHPWPRYWTGFDITANLLGYLPMGFLVALAALRDRGRLLPRALVPLGILLCALLSFAAESLQNWLPQRVPSNVDWLLNTLGGSLGSLLAWGMGKAGALNAWSRMRQHWFVPDAQEGLVLLLLWPWALLYPLPVPFGLGQVQEKLERWLALWLAGTPFAMWLPVRSVEFRRCGCGRWLWWWRCVWLPCLLAFGIMPAWRKRAVVAVVLFVTGILATALGNTLGLGPQHAWAWLWHPVQLGLLGGVADCGQPGVAPRAVCMAGGGKSWRCYCSWFNGATVSAYFGLGLEEWLPGRFIRFYGLTEWIGWLWPHAVLLHLLAHLLVCCSACAREPRLQWFHETARTIREQYAPFSVAAAFCAAHFFLHQPARAGA